MNQAKFPPGWDEERMRRILTHYEEQTEDDAVAEDETTFESRDQTMMKIPSDLVTEIRKLIARHQTRP